MKLSFEGNVEGLLPGIGILTQEKQFVSGETETGETVVRVERRDGPIEILRDGRQGIIRYQDKIHFFRALGLFVQESLSRDRFEILEEPQFQTLGFMIDASRNAVPKVETLKKLIRIMALMGLNMCMLYCEDTYDITELPYFGYMRGKYSHEELKECDDYAALFGIEMIPCIQTLAHLEQALKWNYAASIRDTSDILLVGDEKTYEFVERMIRAASSPFRSKRIHIGMDEAHNLGLGRYLDRNGFRKRFDIMNEHLHRVLDITRKYGLEPMIWSDMYFRLGSPTGDYYDLNANIPPEVIEQMPQDIQFVYWDYYHTDTKFYEEYIRRHQSFGSLPVFAGGIWTWVGMTPAYGKTFQASHAALQACKKTGIREVFATAWGDNGAEANLFTCLPGLQLFAEHGYAARVDDRKLSERFAFCAEGDLDLFMNLRYLDEVPGISEGNSEEANPSKYLLWQDVLLGLFDEHVRGLGLHEYYRNWAEKFHGLTQRSGEWKALFAFYEELCSVLSLKSEMGLNIRESYLRNDKDQLTDLCGQLLELSKRVQRLRELHRSVWMGTNKPFGWEVLDIRYGGLLARIDTSRARLADYAQGSLDRIEELDQERLPFDAYWNWAPGKLGHCNVYHRIATACAFI
jgi:hypothetical protein